MGSDACAQIIELTSIMDNNQQMYDDPQIFSIYTRPSLKCWIEWEPRIFVLPVRHRGANENSDSS